MPNRPKDFSTEALALAIDDYLITDGSVQSTRKFAGKRLAGLANARPGTAGIFGGGDPAARGYATMISCGDTLFVRMRFVWPSSVSTSGLVRLSSTVGGDTPATNDLCVYIASTSSGVLTIQLVGGNSLTVAGATHAVLDNMPVDLLLVVTGGVVTCYLNGLSQTLTGTNSGFSSINQSYICACTRAASESLRGLALELDYGNVALTATEAALLHFFGWSALPMYLHHDGANSTSLITGTSSDFSGALGWTNGGSAGQMYATLDSNTTVAGKCYALTQNNASSFYMRVGSTNPRYLKYFKMTGKVRLNAGTAVALSAGARDGTVANGGRFALPTATGSEQSFAGFFLSDESGDTAIGATGNVANGSAYEYDDILITKAGVFGRWVFRSNGTYQVPDESGNGNQLDLVSASRFLEQVPIGSRFAVKRTYLHSEISSSAATTIHGQLPAGWVVRDYQANVTVGFDAAITLDLGYSGTSNAYVSANAITTTGFRQAASVTLVPRSLTAADPIYIKKSGATTTGAILVVLIIERVY